MRRAPVSTQGGPTRRAALLSLVAAALTPPPLLAATPRDPATGRAALAAYLDVLLPADALTPAASALGVQDDILALARAAPLLGRMIAVVCDWLDGGRPGAFAALPEAVRAERVAQMAASDPDRPDGRFHKLIRLLAIEFYYARPEALPGLGLNPAPQPEGYPPPWA